MPAPSARDARLIVWPVAAASVGMLLWMAQPLVTGQVPFTGDLLHFHYPMRDFYARALAAGQRFEWLPSLFSGFYVAGEGQMGTYHPLHWVLYRFLPLDPAFDLELIAAYPFLFAGTWFFLRRWCDRGPSAFGAMLFASCGFNLSHGVHPNVVSVVAHVPWLLWAIHGVFESRSWRHRARWGAVIGLLTGSQVLLGHPQAVWWSGLIEGAYVLLQIRTGSNTVRIPAIGTVVMGTLLGLTIGAVQLFASLHAVKWSARPAYDVEFATSFSMPPQYLAQLVEPYLFWGRVLRWNEAPGAGDEFAIYGGAVTLALAVWWLASYRGLRARGLTTAADRLGLWACLLGVFGLWLATGSYGRLYYLETWLPIVGEFRAPVRYVLFTQLSLAIVAAVALVHVMQPSEAAAQVGRRALWAPWVLAAVSALLAFWLARHSVPRLMRSSEGQLAVMMGPLLFLAAAVLVTMTARGVRWGLVGLVLLAAGDQALYGLGGVVAWQDFLTRQEAIDLLDTRDAQVPASPARLARGGFPDLFLLGGYRLLDGYVALAPARTLSYQSAAALRVAQVEYAHADFLKGLEVPGAVSLAHGWYRLPAPPARARLVTEIRVSHRPAVDLETLDIDHAALVTHPVELAGGEAGTAGILHDDPGDILMRTNAGGTQLLVVSEAFDDGWAAAIDGAPAPVEQVNGDFLGTVVPAGEHEVSLTFDPAHLVWGKTISVGGLALALLLAASTVLTRSRA